MFTQLNPPMPLHVLGRGDGVAVAVIDYGAEHNLIWVTAINATGEVWCAPNPEVRFLQNWTLGRAEPAAVKASRLGKTDVPGFQGGSTLRNEGAQ